MFDFCWDLLPGPSKSQTKKNKNESDEFESKGNMKHGKERGKQGTLQFP
jgi:hypothetical protein